MAEKRCNRCGHLNLSEANYCSACGASEFTEVQDRPQWHSTSAPESTSQGADMLLGSTRIVALTMVTTGAYLLYWLYLTWKQLRSETGEEHFPVWHALTLLVPVYGLFRLHKHVQVIRDLALNAQVETSLSPGLAVLLVVLNGFLGLGSGGVDNLATILVLEFISLALVSTVIVWSQTALNGYWTRGRGDALRWMPLQTGEKVLIALGVLIWLRLLISILSA
ncbi:MAG: zinc ribbon domain-containing protein [Chloroflexi bacterium]|nr:zinc ribbon domain-containing protein [Chloroflexota bacterium]